MKDSHSQGRGSMPSWVLIFLSAPYTEVAVAILLKMIFRVFSFSSGSLMKFRCEAVSEQLKLRHLAIAKHFLLLNL